MKILISTDQIYLHGGIEKFMATKVNFWVHQPGVEVYILTTEQQGHPPCYPIDPKVTLLELGVDYDRSQSYFSWKNLKKALVHYRRQKAVLQKIQPDVVISPNFNFDHYWLPWIKGKSKLIKERHASRYQEPEQRRKASFIQKLKWKLTDAVESQYDHIVVLNETEATYVTTGNAVVIPNPIEASPFRANPKTQQVMAAGRMAPVKNFKALIEAWALLYSQFPDWQLHLYGEDYGGMQQALEEVIHQKGLTEVVQFKGSVPILTEAMQDYSLYALSSETECFPMVLLEALSVGLPIVSFDCPNDPRHIINHKIDVY